MRYLLFIFFMVSSVAHSGEIELVETNSTFLPTPSLPTYYILKDKVSGKRILYINNCLLDLGKDE